MLVLAAHNRPIVRCKPKSSAVDQEARTILLIRRLILKMLSSKASSLITNCWKSCKNCSRRMFWMRKHSDLRISWKSCMRGAGSAMSATRKSMLSRTGSCGEIKDTIRRSMEPGRPLPSSYCMIAVTNLSMRKSIIAASATSRGAGTLRIRRWAITMLMRRSLRRSRKRRVQDIAYILFHAGRKAGIPFISKDILPNILPQRFSKRRHLQRMCQPRAYKLSWKTVGGGADAPDAGRFLQF